MEADSPLGQDVLARVARNPRIPTNTSNTTLCLADQPQARSSGLTGQ